MACGLQIRYYLRTADGVDFKMKKYVKKLIKRISRLAAKEFLQEINKNGGKPLRIDAIDFIRQLSEPEAKEDLRNLYLWNMRWVSILDERNKRAAESTASFADQVMPDAVFLMDQFAFIESKKVEMDANSGHILDLGVYSGGSTRNLARIFPDKVIHGFDSFEGLPDDWSYVLSGTFDAKGLLPDVPDNVRLYKGWFEDTLPLWFDEYSGNPISVLRIDCDIYSSTKTIFDVLSPLIQPGTWIIFDELIGYSGWQNHEYKAFTEFIEATNHKYKYESYGLTHVILQIID